MRAGVLEWFRPGEHERVERVLDELHALGVERLRSGVSWADYVDEGGEAWYDWLLPRLADEVELLPCVLYTPPSHAVVPRIQAPPRRPRDYADFLDVLLTRHGSCFEHVELWNEPNNLNDWDWTLDPEWEVFSEMLGDAAHWVRERGWKPVLGGMCPTDPHWLDLMGERGLLDLFAAVGLHAFPGSWETIWDGWEATVERAREVLDRHGCGAEVWITETGYSTWRNDELGQAQVFLDALRAPVERVYWYAAEDLASDRSACDGFHVDVRHYHFGLYDAEGGPKLLARLLAQGGVDEVESVARAAAPPRRPAAGPRTLVTGGAGFVGSSLVESLLAEGRRVRVLDSLARPGSEGNLKRLRAEHGGRVEVELADVRDPLVLRRAVEGVEAVFHLAAQTGVAASLGDPVHDFSVNVEGTVRLLDELRRLPEPPFLLFASTSAVYGTLADVPLVRRGERWQPADETLARRGVSEQRPLDPRTPYGCSKGAADRYVLDAAASFGVPATVLRLSAVYGPDGHGDEDENPLAHVLGRALAGAPVTIHGDGAQVCDLLRVDDLVEAMLACREADVAGRAFNVGGGPERAVSVRELLGLVDELAGGLPEVRRAPERAGSPRWYVSDTRLLQAATGWLPRAALADGVEELYHRLDGRERRVRAAAR